MEKIKIEKASNGQIVIRRPHSILGFANNNGEGYQGLTRDPQPVTNFNVYGEKGFLGKFSGDLQDGVNGYEPLRRFISQFGTDLGFPKYEVEIEVHPWIWSRPWGGPLEWGPGTPYIPLRVKGVGYMGDAGYIFTRISDGAVWEEKTAA